MNTNKWILLVVLFAMTNAVLCIPMPDEQAVKDSKEDSSNDIPKVVVPVENKDDSKASAAQESIAVSEVTSKTPTDSVTSKPNVGEGFSRFINDIFQIPISVLKAVNNLVTNPFTQRVVEKKKDQ